MPKGMTIFRIGLAGVLAAGAVIAAATGIGLLARSLANGQVGLLAAGLALGAATLTGAGISAWLVLLTMQGDGPAAMKSFLLRRRIALSILVLFAEIGLTWLLIEFAERHRSGPTWITGGLALLVSGLVVVTWLAGQADLGEDTPTLSPPIVLAEVSLGVLAVGFAAEHNPIVAWLLAGLAIVESLGWMVLPEAVNVRSSGLLSWTPFASAIFIPAASVIGLLIKFALDGNVLGALATGVIGIAAALFVFWRFELLSELSAFFSHWARPADTSMEATIPAFARLAGLVIPLGTIVWAAASQAHGPSSTAAVRLLGAAAWVVLAAIGLLVLQGIAIGWLRPEADAPFIRSAALEAQGEQYLRPPSERRSLEMPGRRTLISAAVEPLAVPIPALSAGLHLAGATGLDVGQVWPRLQLVVPTDVRREVARKDAMVATLRVAAASAICTAVAWPISAGVILSGASGGTLAALAAAPLAAAVATVIVARRRVADVYLRRVRATEVYRFDLVKALHLPLAHNEAEFAMLSRYIDGSSGERPIVWAEDGSPDQGRDLSQLRETLAAEVSELAGQGIARLLDNHRELLLRDRNELLAQQREQFRGWLSAQALGPEELARLADRIADRAANPVSASLGQRLDALGEQFTRGLRVTLEQVVGESVLGPSLTNFTGYLSLELDRSSEEDPQVGSAGGAVRTGPGHELALVMSVVRNPAAARVAPLTQGPDGSFLVLEPFAIEGGRDTAIAEFDAIADCSTLTPRPRRRNLSVGDRASTNFRFKLPDGQGQHELWFQLYQAGRLIQAIAISVEVRPGPGTAA
jgi:hypothetical protein